MSIEAVKTVRVMSYPLTKWLFKVDNEDSRLTSIGVVLRVYIVDSEQEIANWIAHTVAGISVSPHWRFANFANTCV